MRYSFVTRRYESRNGGLRLLSEMALIYGEALHPVRVRYRQRVMRQSSLNDCYLAYKCKVQHSKQDTPSDIGPQSGSP